MFIDASQHFEKVKTQNVLREEDIEQIISTYKAYACHTEPVEVSKVNKDKYSYLAPLTEVAENDYNLNIPRYVDTFEEEEAVNLAEVSQQLKALEKNIAETDTTIADYCAQLNIDTPF